MNNFVVKHSRKLIAVYIFLSVIKLFTARIDLVREEDPTIYFKFSPSVENHFLACVEEGQLSDYYCNKYSWYENKQYWEIFHSPGGMQNFVGHIYSFVINLWWIYSICLIFGSLWSISKMKT